MSKLTLNKTSEKSAINNSGIKQLSKLKLTSSIRTATPFTTIFPINESLLKTIVEDMRTRGFDESQPLLVWKEQEVLIDGHTRLKAALEAGIQQVPIYEKSFATETDAVEYVIHLQKDRRNLTDAELYTCINELDNRYTRGGYRRNEGMNSSSELFTLQDDDNNGKSPGPSREKTAAVIGTSSTKVQKVRTITDHGSAEIKKAVNTGKMSINKAYKATQQERKQEKSPPREEKPEPRVYWEGSELYMVRDGEQVVVMELKLPLKDGTREKILKIVEKSLG